MSGNRKSGRHADSHPISVPYMAPHFEALARISADHRTTSEHYPVDATGPNDGPAGRALRLLHVTARYLPYVGGTELHTYEVARRQAAAGMDVTVLTTDPSRRLVAVELSEGVRIIRAPAWPANADYHFAPSIYRVISQHNWDIVHCQGYHTLVAPLAMYAAWRAGIPYVVTFHSGGHSSILRNFLRPFQRRLLRPLLARAQCLIGVSQFEADFFRRRLRLPRELFRVIPNGASLPPASAVEVDPANALIVSVGRLERYKGHHRIIEALPKIAESVPSVRLRVVGKGPYEANLRQLAQAHGVADRVDIGPIAIEDRGGMANLLSSARLVILLSDYESQAISVMEALSLGRPVLVADTSALRDIAIRGLARAVSLDSPVEDVTEEILRQLNKPHVPVEVTLPTWENCAVSLLEIYRDVARRQQCVS
jgi:glycosyltransferase involved in cell wall biosynthesis